MPNDETLVSIVDPGTASNVSVAVPACNVLNCTVARVPVPVYCAPPEMICEKFIVPAPALILLTNVLGKSDPAIRLVD